MKVSNKFKTQYLDYLKSYLPEIISKCDQFESAVFSEIDSLIELSSLKVCEARKKALALDCEASDLAERTLSLSNGEEFIAGARFKNIRPKGLKFKDLPNAYPSYEKWSHLVFGSLESKDRR